MSATVFAGTSARDNVSNVIRIGTDKLGMGSRLPASQMGFEFMTHLSIPPELRTESELVAAAMALGAGHVRDLSSGEAALIRKTSKFPAGEVEHLMRAIALNRDPLGDAFAVLRTREERRLQGATYTPSSIVQAMVNWAANVPNDAAPDRIVDPGAGSARFLVAADRKFPDAKLIGIDIDPLAALIARANLSPRATLPGR